MSIASNVTKQESAVVIQPQPPGPFEACLQPATTQSGAAETASLDVETEIVVALPPKSRRAVQLRINTINKAEPRVVFDSPDV